MEKVLQKRLVGTAVVVALAVIFVPMMLDGGKTPETQESVSMQIEIPPKPIYDIPNRLKPAEKTTGSESAVASTAETSSAPKTEVLKPVTAPPKQASATPKASTEKVATGKEASTKETVAKKAEPKVVEVPASAKKEMKEPREKVAVKQLANPTAAPGFAVQVGSFSSKANAESLKKKLASNGYPAFVERIQLKTREIFRVKVGPKTSRRDANLLRLELIDEEKIEGILVSYP